jgi:serine protease AprX
VKGALVAGTRHVPGTKTRALLADAALTVQPARVNVGIWPSYVLVYMLAKSGLVLTSGISWEGISWEGISWETISWEGVAWESVSWEGIDWELLTLEPRS